MSGPRAGLVAVAMAYSTVTCQSIKRVGVGLLVCVTLALGCATPSTADTVTRTSISVGAYPASITFAPNGDRAYLAERYTNTVEVINTLTSKVVAQIHGITEPLSMDISPDGRFLYVAGSKELVIISTSSNMIIKAFRNLAGELSLGLSPSGALLYAVEGAWGYPSRLEVIRTSTDLIIRSFNLGDRVTPFAPTNLAIGDNGKRAYIANDRTDVVNVFSTKTGVPMQNIRVGNSSKVVATGGGGQFVFVGGPKAITVINSTSDQIVRTIHSSISTPNCVQVNPAEDYLVESGGVSAVRIDVHSDSTASLAPVQSAEMLSVGINSSGSLAYAGYSSTVSVSRF